jgi:D-aspartate ligase
VIASTGKGNRGQRRGVSTESTKNGKPQPAGGEVLKARGAAAGAGGATGSPSAATGAMPSPSTQRSVLLATAGSGGSIAAARNFGENGIQVGVLSSQLLSAAAWSRGDVRSYAVPPESDKDKFLERLIEVGAANPGQVLLPTSDQTAWLYTLHASLLKRHFCMYQPSIASMRRILDKDLFTQAAKNAGVTVLPSWKPRTFEEVSAIAPGLPYPILIKPTTHVHRLRNDKGVVVHSKAELVQHYERFVAREKARAGEHPLLPDAGLPVLQQFVNVAEQGVYSISGFLDRTGELFVTRRSTKVFQRSQPVGVGVCFESRPASPMLSSAVRRLCRELDYFGIFEVEFLPFGDEFAVIDFNARMFNQVGMDIRRGMPLPLLAYLDAIGDTAGLREAVAKAQTEDESVQTVFCDGFTLRAIILARTLTARITRDDLAYWRGWVKKNSARMVDFALDGNDPMPGFIHALSEIYLGLKAIPKFLRSTPVASVDSYASASASSEVRS